MERWKAYVLISGSASYFPGCCHGYGPNKTEPTHSLDYNSQIPYESRVDTALSFITNQTHPANLVFLYFEEPDELGHGFGPESPEVQESIEKMDNVTGYIVSRLRELGIYDDVNLILLSDHGFQEVRQERIIDISLLLVPKDKYYLQYGSTPTYLILPIEGRYINIVLWFLVKYIDT
jgi:ectonucleotide pyrophosphatase/phosphodiesterase family protein 5